MCRDYCDINCELRNCYIKWYEKVCQPWLNHGGNAAAISSYVKKCYKETGYKFCEPFYLGVPNYSKGEAKPLVMFVGQETNGYNGTDKELVKISAGSEEYVKKSQEWVVDRLVKMDFTPSVFWNFVKGICKNSEINVCWNNLDKIYYRAETEKCIKLYKEDERELNAPFEGKTLLQHEIETVVPDLIVFLVGPGYQFSMETALPGIITKDCKPTKGDSLKEFTIKINDKNEEIPCVWTYHPNYMRRVKDTWDFVRRRILSIISGLKG